MALIVVGGMIGLGKSSTAKVLGEALKSDVFYENVENNEILPLFYTATEEEAQEKRYPFLLQLEFLHSRFSDIKQALVNQKNVLDRSIYEDWYFAKVNNELGRISDTEFSIYEKLLNNMMEELEELPKKAPDLMVYLKASFETTLFRIGLRGREFEQDESLVEYYRTLWEGYDDWLLNHYDASEVLIIDMDETDVVNNPEDAEKVVEQVNKKLKEMGIN
ncbi:deoxynucleoside kinase [Priestia aryabhattai]|uniref:deoxynucleoside kinase n=1 Tax=Priestia aryabhattai TaxID=412384 RepID=UPI00203E9068|nr:deoxynucleoside kinase [Priestia aryabhattai]MCM3639672.1 deoxynucleoside kinase [Priestia aryabhattai]